MSAYRYKYRIHTSTHTALEMRTAEEPRQAMSCSAALAETQMPLADLGEPLSPAAIAACLKTSQCHLVKPQPGTVDSFLLMTPHRSPRSGKAGWNKGAKQLPFPLWPVTKRGKGHPLPCPASAHFSGLYASGGLHGLQLGN